jgi:hypothetical protein
MKARSSGKTKNIEFSDTPVPSLFSSIEYTLVWTKVSRYLLISSVVSKASP